ncbi:Cupin domain protein [Verrucomicrobiia bacterium DG1235]|nr:Cupin domain protein [Verrucomicrobiae bacterium DG1235]
MTPKIPALVRLIALIASLSIGSIAIAEESTTLKSCVFDWNTRVEKPTGVGIYRGVTDKPSETLERFECHITTLHAGNESHPPHQHPQEEFIILQEGELDVHINGVDHRIGAGGMFFFASYDWHAVHNVGDGPATYLVFNYESGETRKVRREPAANWAPKTALASAVFPWSDGNGAREFFNSPTVTLNNLKGAITQLAPGENSAKSTSNPAATVLAVRDGELDVTINGEHSKIGRGSIVFISSNDKHTLSNSGDSDTVYYVFQMTTDKTPKS